ncbi:MAG: hypothetical protein AAF329_01170 [Cyanobacteria bacterium P01_A01_bin.17]
MPDVDLTCPNPNALAYSQLRDGEHFALTELAGLWHWESIGPCEGYGLCSADGFETAELAAEKAKETIALASAYGVEQALALIDGFATTMARLYPSDRNAIHNAIKVLPKDERWVAAYGMAKRSTPMPARYWPNNLVLAQ